MKLQVVVMPGLTFSYDHAMLRLLLITLMLLQPIQWAWAAVHVTSDAAHAITHNYIKEAAPSVEIVVACSLMGDAADGHSCHDNHTHNATVLGLGNDDHYFKHHEVSGKITFVNSLRFAPLWVADIDRPKWIAAR